MTPPVDGVFGVESIAQREERRNAPRRRGLDQMRLVASWNKAHGIGTVVNRFELRDRQGASTRTKTRSEAWLMGGHTAMVMVEGVSGGVALDSLEVVK